jgi:hypothetical protein
MELKFYIYGPNINGQYQQYSSSKGSFTVLDTSSQYEGTNCCSISTKTHALLQSLLPLTNT